MEKRKLFTTIREKRLWISVVVVIAAIYSTLFLGQPLAEIFSNQNTQAFIFVAAMVLVGTTIIVHGIRTKPSHLEIVVILGITAVYSLFFFRLGLPERSHLMEYSVLAIFLHKALTVRSNNGRKVPYPALLAILIAAFIGVLDECIQAFIPDRVFDYEDMLFNLIAVVMAVASACFIDFIKRKKPF